MLNSLVPVKHTSSAMLDVVKQAIAGIKPGERFVGKLPNIEGRIYTLGDNKGVYHYVKEHNFGYFTAPESDRVVGYVFPQEERKFAVYQRKNGDLSTDMFDGRTCSCQMIIRDKEGKIKNLYNYANGKGEYACNPANLYTN